MPDSDTPLPHVPESRALSKKRTRLSVVWIIPIVAAVIGVWVAVTRILAEGPKVTIVFASADGLEAGKTKIQCNGVEVGTLETVRLSDDHKTVVTTAQMAPKTDSFLLSDTRFWVVRPRISGANISGLGLSSTNFADRLLSKHHVAVVPGVAFGDDRTVRLSYATSLDVIKKGLDRFQDFCRTL